MIQAQLPDGRILEFPDGTDQRIIQSKVKEMLGIGQPSGTDRERLFREDPTSLIPGMEQSIVGKTARGLPEIGNAPELNELSMSAFKTSLGLLTTGDTESLKGIFRQQFGKDVDIQDDGEGGTVISLPSGKYALNKPGLSGQDIARAAFNMVAFTPAGRAATVARAAGGSAVTEGLIQGTEQALGGEEVRPTDIAIAGGLGGGFKAAEKVIGGAVRSAGPVKNDVVEAGEQAGIPVLTSDVRQPKTFAGRMAQQTGEKIPIAGTGGIRESQQEMRNVAVQNVFDKYAQFSHKAIVDSLKSQSNKVKRAAGNVLNQVGEKLDNLGEIPLSNTSAAISRAQQALSKKGVIQTSDAVDDLQSLINAIDEAPQTFTTLKENRTMFMEMLRGAGKGERSQLPTRAKGILESVSSAIKKDMDDFAKANLPEAELSKWFKANAVYASEAKKLTRSRIKSVLDKGDITPEAVETMLFSKRPSEVKNLYSSLSKEGRDNARAAVINRAIDNLSKRTSGITPNAFYTEMQKLGLQVDTFFKGEEKKQINGLVKALGATKRAQEASVTTPTGQTLWGLATGAAAVTDLGATVGLAGTAGAFARLYESAPVRNALLRLDSIPAGSTAFDKALRELNALLISSVQTMRREQEDTQ